MLGGEGEGGWWVFGCGVFLSLRGGHGVCGLVGRYRGCVCGLGLDKGEGEMGDGEGVI